MCVYCDGYSLHLSTDLIQLPIPANFTLLENTPSSVLISIEPQVEYDSCITSYIITVDNGQCPRLELVNNSKYHPICEDLDLYGKEHMIGVAASGSWLAQSSALTKPFNATGESKLKSIITALCAIIVIIHYAYNHVLCVHSPKNTLS